MMMEEETIGDIENEINNLSNNNSLAVKTIVNNVLTPSFPSPNKIGRAHV